jgi:Fe-S-cluster containining protein
MITQLQQTLVTYRQEFALAKAEFWKRLDALWEQLPPELQETLDSEALEHPLFYRTSANDASSLRTRLTSLQQEALIQLEETLGKELLQTLESIQALRNQIQCQQTGDCCRLASSEFSWEELLSKAASGDSFARQFTSVFLPYASEAVVRQRYPEVVAEVLAYAQPTSENGRSSFDVYFYHCPHVTEDNLCGLWGNAKRPSLCATYPETPLTFTHKRCAWRPWQKNHHGMALRVHAALFIGDYVTTRLKDALATTLV